jgi:hypothetical protein
MSYNLMVFNKAAAPKTRAEFMQWYEVQTEWTEEHSYDDPANTSVELRNWFMEVIQTFPAMNGLLASEDEDNIYVTDYSIGKDIIYVSVAWTIAEQAHIKMFALAEKHGVGFFEASNDNGAIYFPDNGKLKPIDNPANKTKNASDNQKSNPGGNFGKFETRHGN